VKPYYQDDAVTIYHGDCRDILPTLEPVDLVLTDPPYGVGMNYLSYDDTRDNWIELMDWFIPLSKLSTAMTILPCSRILELGHFYRNYPLDWLMCWYKGSPGTSAFVGFNDWEPLLVYGKIHGLQMHDYFYAQPEPFDNGHPCPKPLAWAKWLIAKSTAQTVLDPFMGSGTTLRAAKDLGRKAIGIEIEERYCEIAAKRMSQMVMDLCELEERCREIAAERTPQMAMEL